MKYPFRRRESSVTSGYLIFSGLAVILFALAFKDPMFIVFGIPIVFVFALASSEGKGGVDRDLEAIGWSGKNIDTAVPLGVVGGITCLIVGGILVRFTPANVASIVPDFSSLGAFTTASVIPPFLGIGMNIISQWSVVVPAETAGYRVLAPFAGQAVFKNVLIAYIVASLLWILTHVPTFIMQGTSVGMYYVLAMMSIIEISLLYYTGSILSPIISHGVFNTGVILFSENANVFGLYVVLVIAFILSLAWYMGRKKKTARRG